MLSPEGRELARLDALFVVGPTASGKSALGARLAARIGFDVVSMDSMQVYRSIPIVSAQPEPELLRLAPHHLLEVVDPADPFDTARYLERCRRTLAEVRDRGGGCVFVGGTALYFHALTVGLSPMPGASPDLRRELVESEREGGPGTLHRLLEQADPATAARLHPNDTRRLVRALEICRQAGRPVSELVSLPRDPVVRSFFAVGLEVARERLYPRIDRRVDEMWERGLVDEIRRLRARLGPGRHSIQQAIGYRQIVEFLDGRYPEEEARRLVQRDSRRFARRQIRQFHGLPEIVWVEPGGAAEDLLVERVLAVARQRVTGGASARP